MERAGQALSTWLGEQFEWSSQDREVAAFSLALILSSLFFIGLLTIISTTLGVVGQAFAMAFSAGILRTFAGGAHLSTGWRCGTISAAAAVGVALSAKWQGPSVHAILGGSAGLVTMVIAVVVVWIMSKEAPADVPEKPITSSAQRAKLRTMSMVVPLGWGVLWVLLLQQPSLIPGPVTLADAHGIWLASTAGLLWETLSVTPPGKQLVHSIDRQFTRIPGKGQRRKNK